jgi:hypothetical protein
MTEAWRISANRFALTGLRLAQKAPACAPFRAVGSCVAMAVLAHSCSAQSGKKIVGIARKFCKNKSFVEKFPMIFRPL